MATMAVRAADNRVRFERTFLPHLDAAYNLARWLTRNPQDAEDVVQEAYLRAFTYFDGFHGEDGRAWLLTIVRTTCYTWLRKNRPAGRDEFEEERHGVPADSGAVESARIDSMEGERIEEAMRDLPAEFREAIVLREMEGLSYKQISSMTGVPVGTVMSRLARARERLRRLVRGAAPGE